MKTPLLLTLATAVGLPIASAQDDRRPENPPRPPEPERQPGQRPDRPHDQREDGDRPRAGNPERERGPDVERRRDGGRDGDARRGDGQRPGGPGSESRGPEGQRREGDLRDTPRAEGDRRDGLRAEPRQPGAPRDRDREPSSPMMARPQKPTAYVGVVTTQVPPPMGAQLGLPEGFGLVVGEVIPDGPAARAGVQQFDVLTQFNDQLLIDPAQLAALVRRAGKDADVSLTVIRQGDERKVNVKIGERMLPHRNPMPEVEQIMRNLAPMRERAERGAKEMQERLGTMQREFQSRMKEYSERMKDFGNRTREYHERATRDRQNPGGVQPPRPPEPPQLPMPPQLDSPFGPSPGGSSQKGRSGAGAGVRVEPDGNVTVWNTANARATMKDADGEVEVRNENGKRSVTARGADGEVTFTGSIDTEEERAALPETVRRKIERMDVQARVGGENSPAAPIADGGEIPTLETANEEPDIQ